MVILVAIAVMPLVGIGDPSAQAAEPLQAQEAPAAPEEEYVLDQIIVKFKHGTLSAAVEQLNQTLGTEVIYTSPFAWFKVLQIPEGKTVAEMVNVYSEQAIVEYAEPNYIRHAAWSPNDPLYPYQWHFAQINLGAAWDLDTIAPLYGGDPSIIVAIIDTGVAYETYDGYVQAPDLASTTFTGGYDFVNNDAHPNDDNCHGTHVCGTIAQSTNNGEGVAGIAFNTVIMPIKVLPGGIAEEADGIYYATDNGANIINLSLSGPGTSITEENAVAYAYNHGVTIICAAGNDYETGNDPEYPAAYDDYCIAVGATRYDQAHAPYSNTGSYLDIAAPGGDITVDQNDDGYADGVLQQTFAEGDPTDFGYYFLQGTSMACPHVAGVAALILAENPSFTPDQVRQALESTATDLGDAGRDDVYGWGLLNAAAAVSWAPAGAPTVTSNPAASVEETTATLNGTVTDDGGEACPYRFGYGTTQGGPYTYTDWSVETKTTGQSFSEAISSLNKGTKYYFRAQAKNSGGTASGSELTFLTKPNAPTSFTASTAGTTQINLSWTKGDGAQKTKIQRKEGSYPANRNDGTQVYFGTGTSTPDIGLVPSTTYYYRAWSEVSGSQQWSDNYAQAWATTTSAQPNIPDITVSPTSFEESGPPDTTWASTLTIGNVGNADLSYSISDRETTGPTAPAGVETATFGGGQISERDGLIELTPSQPMSFARAPMSGSEIEIAYDDGVADSAWYWASGGLFAVRFTPESYPVALESARIHFWPELPDTDHEQFAMQVYDDNGAGGAPGSQLGATVYATASEWGWCDVDISGQGITVTDRDFYIAYKQLTEGPDCEGLCADYTDPDGRSWLGYGGDWWPVEEDTGPMDWMIRCLVEALDEGCAWLDEEPKSGTVPPGGEADITVTFDTTGLGSTYTANIIISSNDPDESEVIVPVTLTVTTGVSPSVSIEPPSQTVAPGGTFDIDVWVDASGHDLIGISVEVQYDAAAMATSDPQVTGHNLLGDMQIGPTVTDGSVTYDLVNVTPQADVLGSVLTIEFTIDAGAAPGDYDITLTTATLLEPPVPGVDVVEDITHGTVTVVTGRKGDFDNDDDIDIFDFVLFAAAYGSELGDDNYNAAGDFDDDGDIDIFDFVQFAAVYGT